MLHSLDLLVLIAYLTAVVALGCWFARGQKNSDEFMAAGRAMPGWAIGLSMFGSYVSSISFLGNPGSAYGGNWNAFVFSITTPIAAAIAVRWFVPFFRRAGEVSAYEHLEHRFGPWARTYAVCCFLLYQMARMGAIIYLLALAMAPLTGWSAPALILLTGALATVYTMAGGMKAVVWVGVMQSLVLVAGTALCVVAVLVKTPGGFGAIVKEGVAYDKFSLGSFGPSLVEPTFWVVFAYGLVMNLGNYGADQSYVQRYIAARSDREAAKSVWITALSYVPTAAVFFFIGTALFVFYRGQPNELGDNTIPDAVFPHFITTQLPAGLAGLVVAAIFAASLDLNLNNMATLTLCDVYQRYFRPQAGERESLRVLRLATLAWGVAGTGVAFWFMRHGDKETLDKWWALAGFFSGGILGLFLLGLVSRTAGNAAAKLGVIVGVLTMIWMTLPKLIYVPEPLRNAMHANMTIVIGTLVIFLVGLGTSRVLRPGSRG